MDYNEMRHSFRHQFSIPPSSEKQHEEVIQHTSFEVDLGLSLGQQLEEHESDQVKELKNQIKEGQEQLQSQKEKVRQLNELIAEMNSSFQGEVERLNVSQSRLQKEKE